MGDARDAFAQACVVFADLFDPDLIVVGGSLAVGQGDRLLGPAREAVASLAFTAPARRVRIELAALGDDVSLVGAAVLVRQATGRSLTVPASGSRWAEPAEGRAGRRRTRPWHAERRNGAGKGRHRHHSVVRRMQRSRTGNPTERTAAEGATAAATMRALSPTRDRLEDSVPLEFLKRKGGQEPAQTGRATPPPTLSATLPEEVVAHETR